MSEPAHRSDLSPAEKRSLLARLLGQNAKGSSTRREEIGVSTSDLQAEALLDSSIQAAGLPFQWRPPSRAVFLTGATGFVGRFLLADLLRHTQAAVYCLVRSPGIEEATERLRIALKSCEIWRQEQSSRIIPVPGDLCKPFFGLSEAEFSRLAGAVDTIYHAGALVKWVFPYESLKPTNVFGTQEVLRLAAWQSLKPVHHLSTVAVFPVLTGSRGRAVREDDALDHGGLLLGGYTQSKWVAEKLVEQARARGIPVAVYRLALVSGDSQTGMWNAEDVICKALQTVVRSGVVPDTEARLNMVPVDYVSRAIVHISQGPSSAGRTFHLAHAQPVLWTEIVSWLNAHGYRLRKLPYRLWRALAIGLGGSRGNAASYLLPLFSVNLSEEDRRLAEGIPEYDCRNAMEALAGASVACPPMDARLFQRYVAYFVRAGLLPRSPVDGGLL